MILRSFRYTYTAFKFITAAAVLLLAAVAQLAAQSSSAQLILPAALSSAQLQAFPDALAVRSEFLSQVVTATPSLALRFRPVYRNTAHGRIRVSVEREGDKFFVLFQYERDGEYPYAAKGNIIIQRAVSTGYIENIKWVLSDDGRNYVSLSARNERTLVDYVVAGVVVNRAVSVNVMIYYFLLQPFSHLHSSLQRAINWKLAFPPTGPDSSLSLMEGLRALPRGTAALSGALAELVHAAANPERLGAYLQKTGRPLSEFAELVQLPFAQQADPSDPRVHAVQAIPVWMADSGFSLAALPAVLPFETGRLFLALVNCKEGHPSRNLLLLPWVAENGEYRLFCYDAVSRTEFTVEELIEACAINQLRLFSLPLLTP
ncbi:MAG: hypothetical protein KKI09_17020 [Spirochaetes bacterium]|nr:hypothetical protein [Spirochaetota bacterium]MBU0957129.1 hypothetical protein [Spirochaetota bacterium]